jgi:hypothetical protein
MKSKLYCKVLALSVIFLFIGVSFSSAINIQSVSSKEEYTEEEVREVLLETIVDVVNNPDVKEQLKSNEYQIRIKDGNYQNIIRKILFRNPGLLYSIFILKQDITIDSLNRLYDIGLRLSKVLDEDELLQLKNSIEVTSYCGCCDLTDIIMENEKLNHLFTQYPNEILCNWFSSFMLIYWSYALTITVISGLFHYIPILSQIFEAWEFRLAHIYLNVICPIYEDTLDCGQHVSCN